MYNHHEFVAFDTCVLRSSPEKVKKFSKISARPIIVCCPYTLWELYCQLPSAPAAAAIQTALDVSERYARPHAAIQRSILSIAQYSWNSQPTYLSNNREKEELTEWVQYVISKRNSYSDDVKKKERELKSKASIQGNQQEFQRLQKIYGIKRTEIRRKEAFSRLCEFSFHNFTIQRMCLTFIPIVFASFPTAKLYRKEIFKTLLFIDNFKASIFVFLYQVHRQLIDCRVDISYVKDFRILMELPPGGVLVSEDGELCTAASMCDFLPVVSKENFFRQYLTSRESEF